MPPASPKISLPLSLFRGEGDCSKHQRGVNTKKQGGSHLGVRSTQTPVRRENTTSTETIQCRGGKAHDHPYAQNTIEPVKAASFLAPLPVSSHHPSLPMSESHNQNVTADNLLFTIRGGSMISTSCGKRPGIFTEHGSPSAPPLRREPLDRVMYVRPTNTPFSNTPIPRSINTITPPTPA